MGRPAIHRDDIVRRGFKSALPVGKKAGKRFGDIRSKTLQLFQKYNWPGNIRELQNVIERAVILCDGKAFSVDESWLRQESSPASGPVVPLVTTLEDRERQMIEEALAQSRGRISGQRGQPPSWEFPARRWTEKSWVSASTRTDSERARRSPS
jgi:transcriptional regulator with AAA-type ATPase domain